MKHKSGHWEETESETLFESDPPQHPQQHRRGWEEDTLVDKLDVYIQMLHVLEDLLNIKADQNEGLSPEETARAATVLSIYRRKYDKARAAWVEIIS